MKFLHLETSQVNEVFEELSNISEIDIRFNKAYLELVTRSQILDLLYTPDFSDVFLRYKTSELTSFEEWVSENPVKAAEHFNSEYGNEITLFFKQRSVGEKLGWNYETETYQMCIEPTTEFDTGAEEVTEGNLEGAVELMMQDWWNREEAESFMKAALKTKGSALKEIRKDGKTVAVGQISVSGDLGWIAVTYVDENHRKQGLGTEIVHSLLKEAGKRGAEKVCLSAEKESGAAEFYHKLGFETTDFSVHEFKPH